MFDNFVDTEGMARALGSFSKRPNATAVTYLLELIDELCGPDAYFIVKLCVFGLAPLTKGKIKNGNLTVWSTKAFEDRFGFDFKVTVHKRPVDCDYFYDFLWPEEWGPGPGPRRTFGSGSTGYSP